jgi:hypothetical protein
MVMVNEKIEVVATMNQLGELSIGHVKLSAAETHHLTQFLFSKLPIAERVVMITDSLNDDTDAICSTMSRDDGDSLTDALDNILARRVHGKVLDD